MSLTDLRIITFRVLKVQRLDILKKKKKKILNLKKLKKKEHAIKAKQNKVQPNKRNNQETMI